MNDDHKQEFLHSLDLTDEEIEKDIPFILENLWELGSMPEYIIRLMKKHITSGEIKSVTDFGCGKGAVLIQAALEMDFHGLGIDVVPAFIDAAKEYALRHKAADRITFQTGDITKIVHNIRQQDIVIYGYDSGVLGDVKTSLDLLKNCTKIGGWIILEAAYTRDDGDTIEGLPCETDLCRQIEASGLTTIEKIVWDVDKLKEVNMKNNSLIQQRLSELTARFPAKATLYAQYMENQLEECMLMENEMVCSTWLLQMAP